VKRCSTCGLEKPTGDFHKRKDRSSGLASQCKTCVNERHRSYYVENREQVRSAHRSYYKSNKDTLSRSHHLYYESNRDEILRRTRKWSIDHPSIVRKSCREWGQRNRKKIRERVSNALRENPILRVKKNLRIRICKAVRRSHPDRFMELLGCTVEELKIHLERKFLPDMSWDNYGYRGWHIDHVRPCVLFDLAKPSEQRKCFHYSNLQPLWAFDNMSKSGKFVEEGV